MLLMHRPLVLFHVLTLIVAAAHTYVHKEEYDTILPVRATDFAGNTIDAELVWRGESDRPLLRVSSGAERTLEEFLQITPRTPATAPLHGLPWFDLQLWGAERVAVQRITGSAEQISVVFAGRPYEWPASVLARIAHYGEALPVLRASFDSEGDLRSVELHGQARVRPGKGIDQTAAVELRSPGDELETALPHALAEGTSQLLLFDPGPETIGTTVIVELSFQRGNRLVPVHVLLAPGEDLWGFATPEGPPSAIEPVARQPGWHRIRFDIEADRIQASVDNAVLSVIHQPLGRLVAIRVRAETSDEPQAAPGTSSPVYVDDLQVYERLPAVLERQPARDQDEVMLHDGQQFYGKLSELSNDSITLQSTGAALRFPWKDVYAVFLAPRPGVPALLNGQRVRVVFRVGTDSGAVAPSNLEGILKGLSDDSVHLLHPVLGQVIIPFSAVNYFLPGRYGNWLLIDHRFHHLGDEVDLDLQRPYPEGNELAWTFELPRVPSTTWLVADVVDLEPMQEGAPYFQQLKEGFLRTELVVNGHSVDFLNRYVLLGNRREPKRIRVELPADVLRPGENTLELRQKAQKGRPGSYDDFGIFGLGIEWPAEDK